jgi:hypothetical protein
MDEGMRPEKIILLAVCFNCLLGTVQAAEGELQAISFVATRNGEFIERIFLINSLKSELRFSGVFLCSREMEVGSPEKGGGGMKSWGYSWDSSWTMAELALKPGEAYEIAVNRVPQARVNDLVDKIEIEKANGKLSLQVQHIRLIAN